MPKLRNLSAKQILKFLQQQNFIIDRQKGSHIVLVRQLKTARQVMTLPNHDSLDKGTSKALYNQARRFISEDILHDFFYS